METTTIKTPGKLMVAGEFAVLEPYHKLIVMAVDRFVYTDISQNDKNIIHLPDLGLNNMTWELSSDRVYFHDTNNRTAFVQAAFEIALTYLQEIKTTIKPFSLTLQSELDDPETGAKYGLGSSAAVVTSIVEAILTFHLGNQVEKELIFKLASIAHVKIQGNGSGADIAASTYGGVLEYTSFQAEWLLKEIEQTPNIIELVKKEWKYLSIQVTAFPPEVDIVVGWTGKPASTKSLVNDILRLRHTAKEQYEAFLACSEQAVKKIVHGMQHEDVPMFLKGISENRQALAMVGVHADVPIETEKLAKLSDIAEQFGGAGKLSGAGGGDCGIAFVEKEVNVGAMHKAWLQEAIEILDIQVYQKN